MIATETLETMPAGHPGTNSFLSEREWGDIRTSLARGVTVEKLYPLVADKYKNAKSFRRAIENRFGKIWDFRLEILGHRAQRATGPCECSSYVPCKSHRCRSSENGKQCRAPRLLAKPGCFKHRKLRWLEL